MVVAPDVPAYIKEEDFFTLKTHAVPYVEEGHEHSMLSLLNTFFITEYSLTVILSNVELMKNVPTFYVTSCMSLLHSKGLMHYPNSSSIDVIVTDSLYPCGALLAKYLYVPAVFLLRFIPCDVDIEAAQCPDPSSYVLRLLTGNLEHMSFLERVKNILYPLLFKLNCHFSLTSYESLASELFQRTCPYWNFSAMHPYGSSGLTLGLISSGPSCLICSLSGE